MLVSHVQGLQSGATAPPTLHKQVQHHMIITWLSHDSMFMYMYMYM